LGRALTLAAVIAAHPACRRDSSDPCATLAEKEPPAQVAEACERRFEEVADPEAGLKALRARGTLQDFPAAERLAQKLRGTTKEAEALVGLSDLALRLARPDAPSIAAAATERLSKLGDHGHAAQTAKVEAEAAWVQLAYQRSLAALARSAEEATRANDRQAQARAGLAQFFLLYELGDLRNASRVLGRAEATAPAVDRTSQALVALYRGLLAEAEGRPQLARVSWERAIELTRETPDSQVSWNAHLNILELALNASDLTRAEAAWAAADRIWRQSDLRKRPSSRAAWAFYSAQLERLRGRPAEVLATLAPLAADKPNRNWRWKIAHERGRALLTLGKLQEARAAFEEAMAGVEGLRGEQALEQKSWVLEQRRAPFVTAFAHYVAVNQPEVALDVLERVQGRSFLDAFAASSQAGLGGEDARFVATAKRAESLKKLMPALAGSVLGRDEGRVNGRELAAALRDEHVVAFFEGEDTLSVVVVQAGRARILSARGSRSELRDLVARLIEDPGDDATAAELGARLFPPGALPARGGTVYIAPTGSLGRLPFAALRVGGRYLAESHVLAEVPSLHALLALRRAARAGETAPAIFGNASGDLPGAAEESRLVQARLGGEAVLFLGADASSTRLREVRGRALLHFAVHSGVGATGPWLGLSDREVLGTELLEWGVHAGLVVLASCASAATPDPGLWGSLTASFLAAGTPAVLGALWSIEDGPSRAFIDRFYADGGHRDPAGALARAQRQWIKEGRPARTWAGFVYFGDARAMEERRRPALKEQDPAQAPYAERN
jgi:tetratricopeptide (TPR) repeat protein